MKSLKRTLCLVLAMVMVLGFFGIASAESFKDDDTIQYKEAVDVMTGIGSINGMGDGTFAPTGKVTRAQAAKMVAYAVLGADVAKTLPASTSRFKDVDSNFAWAIPSIEYLANAGVINGRGNGTFDPNGEITAYEIAKMLLCAAGYGVNGEFTGDSWALNVAIIAQKNKVFAGSKTADLNKAATREECALYCFNVLTTVDKVVYDKDTSSYVDDTTTTTLADEVYQLQAVAEGVLTSNQANSLNKYTTVNGVDYNITTGLDLVGHYVRVYYKSVYTNATTPGVTYAVVDLSTKVDVAKNITTPTAWNTAFGTGTITNTLAGSTNLVTNYAATTGAVTGLDIANKAANAGSYILYKGDIKTYIAPVTYAVDVVSSYTAPTATATGSLVLEGGSTITVPKTSDTAALAAFTYSIYDAPAAKDVVCVQTTGALTTITKATTATGKVSAVNLTATPNTLTAGSTYSKSAAFTSTSSILSLEAFATALVGTDCTFYLGTDGAVVAIVANSTTTDAGFVYVVDAYEETVTSSYGVETVLVKAQCIDMTGKEVNYIVGANNGAIGLTLVQADALDGYLCKVTTAANATLKTDLATLLKAADAAGVTDSSTYYGKSETDAAVTSTAKIADGQYFAADTQFIYVTGTGATGDLKVTTATGAQTIPASTAYSYYSTKTAAAANYTVKYVVVAAQPAASSSASLMFVPQAFNKYSAVSYTTAAGTTATGYNNVAFIDGTPSTSILVTGAEADSITTPGFYTFAKDATTGLYDLTACYAANTVGFGRVNNVYGDLATIKGFTGNGTTWAAGNVTDATASSAKIVDVLYLQDLLLNGGANGLSQHSTLASLNGKVVFYSYKVVSGVTTVDCIYYVADSSVVISAQPTGLTAGGNLTVTAANFLTGDTTGLTYQWKHCDTVDGTYANDDNTGNTTAILTISDNSDNGFYYCAITNALTGETVNTSTVEVAIP